MNRKFLKIVISVFCFLCLFVFSSYAKDKTAENNAELIAHMGLSARAPMNTIEAFEEAYKAGCFGIETDIRLTSDDVLVCFHDASLERTTNGNGKVSSQPWNYLKDIYYTSHTEGLKKYPNATIPSFEEYVEFCKTYNMTGIIDVKYAKDYKGVLDEAYRVVNEYDMKENMIFQCSETAYINYLNSLEYGLRKWLLTDKEISEDLLSEAVDCGCEAINTNKISEQAINSAHEKNINVCFYTVNSLRKYNEYNNYNIDYIMTDGYSEEILNRRQ